MMKHIVIDARIRPSSTGRYADRLLEHLQKIETAGYRFTVLVKPDDPWRTTAQNFAVLKCKYSLYTFNPLQQISFALWLHRLNADLIHFAMSPQDPAFYFGKHITTTHDLTMLRFAKPGKLPVFAHKLRMTGYRLLMWQTHRKAKAVIAISKYVRDDIVALHPFVGKKTVTILEASEPPLKIAPKPLQGLRKPFIMHVGSPFPHKNIERLVEAFEILKSEQPDLQLVLAGKREFYFEQLIQEKISKSPHKKDIIIPGFVTDAELKWLYENTACYVLPSLSEGFGLPGLEAMAHGTPLASSDATCLPEIYGNAASYFDPFDIHAIAVVVNEILTDSSKADKLRTLGKKQLDLYSWKKMAKETFFVYEDVLNR